MTAFGRIKRIEKKDGSLIGEVELNDLVKEAFEQGLYKKVQSTKEEFKRGIYPIGMTG